MNSNIPETGGALADKVNIRLRLRETIAGISVDDRHAKSIAACSFVTSTPEFQAAHTVMIYLSTPREVDTAPVALKAWQQGKTVIAPKVNFDALRMVGVEISNLSSDHLTLTGRGFREPTAGNPFPVSQIDLVIVPGLGFTASGHRIGRGMGFYDRFLSDGRFIGLSIGLAFEEQVVDQIPMLEHDVAMSILATDRGIRRVCLPGISQLSGKGV